MGRSQQYDYLLVGGGLQAGLLVMALRQFQPSSRVLVIEKGDRLGGNHTWSCHQTDLPDSCETWLNELPWHTWPSYRVKIGDFQREVHLGYQSIGSSQFDQYLRQVAIRADSNFQVRFESEVCELRRRQVELQTGEMISAGCVIDCRGPFASECSEGLGYQKFFGWEIQLDTDWEIQQPLIMDAEFPQQDGYRFTYVLPFSQRRILIQDTRFSESRDIDIRGGSQRLTAYLHQHGHQSFKVIREEHGCLPMPFANRHLPVSDYLSGGYRGGYFHAATGYSLPLAARFAEAIAQVPPEHAFSAAERLNESQRFQLRFSRFLNRLLFRMVRPERRIQIFRGFYQRLPEAVISRFYSHTFSKADALRVILGKPPRGLTPVRFLLSYKVNS